MSRITQLDALEILDSRGRPTLAVTIGLDDRVLETVSVPSGASTGRAEAKELRDQNKRYRGLGTRRAVANVCGPIAAALLDRDFTDQDSFDRTLIDLDATPDKSHFGANAILATSLAFARATAQLAIVYEIYQSAADLVSRKYNSRALTADEGGLAPPFRHSSEMLESAAEAIDAGGFRIGEDVALAVDLAASQFLQGQKYHLDGQDLAAESKQPELCLRRAMQSNPSLQLCA